VVYVESEGPGWELISDEKGKKSKIELKRNGG
jgi:hypothetical protein